MSNDTSLSKKVIKGGLWVFSSRIFVRLIGFIRIIIIARLLSPKDFGLFGLLLLTLSVLEILTQTGFHSALIQKAKDIKPYLNTVWTIHVVRGGALYLALYILAPFIANFFNSPTLTLYLKVVGLTVILNGFTNIGIVYFKKDIELSRQFLITFLSTIIEFVSVIILAYYYRNVWALVIGNLIGNFVNTATSYLLHPYRPKFDFNLAKTKELFSYGKWLMSSSIIIFFTTQGDDAFVGKLLGATLLGFYQMAYKISNMATTEITHVIASITLPAFSKIQDNKKRLKESFLRTVSFISYLSFPLAVITFLLADDLVYLILGKKWEPIIPIIKILCVEGLFRSIGASTGPLLSGIGKPKYITFFTTIRFILLAALIYPLTSRWGLIGTSYAVISGALLSPFIFGKILKIISCPVREFMNAMLIPLINTIIVSCIIFIIKKYILINPSIPRLILILMVSISVYLFCSFYLEIKLKYPILKPLIATVRKR